MSDGILSAIERLGRRMSAAIGVGRVTLVDDDGGAQSIQVRLSANEIRDAAPRIAEYGFTSNPPPGSDAVIVFIAGDRSQGIVIATGNQTYRLTGLGDGDVALYDTRGQHVKLTATGMILDAPLGLTVNGNVTIVGDTTQTGAITATQEITSTLGGTHTLTKHDHGNVTNGSGVTATPTG